MYEAALLLLPLVTFLLIGRKWDYIIKSFISGKRQPGFFFFLSPLLTNLLSIYTSLEMPEQFEKLLCFTITLYSVRFSSKDHLVPAATAAQQPYIQYVCEVFVIHRQRVNQRPLSFQYLQLVKG